MVDGDCIWTFDDIDGKRDTACGEAFCFIDGNPSDNGMKFCPYCGKPLVTLAALGAVDDCTYDDEGNGD